MIGFQYSPTRRDVIRSLVGGSLLLPGVLSQLLADEPRPSNDPLTPKKPHYAPKAKRIILLFSTGGVSHMDTFDPKPKLFAADGKTLGVGGGLSLEQRPLLKPRWEFKPGGKCGTAVSDLFPHVRDRMDDICLIRSMTTDNNEHFQATLAIHTGSFFVARPSIGSWISYGLGTFNQNLPSFVVIAPQFTPAPRSLPHFLPAYHQGARDPGGADPNVKRQSGGGLQELELGLRALNASTSSATATTPTWPRASAPSRPRSRCSSRPRKRSTCRRNRRDAETYGLERGQKTVLPAVWSPAGWRSAACAR
jgi:hypothetical protein